MPRGRREMFTCQGCGFGPRNYYAMKNHIKNCPLVCYCGIHGPPRDGITDGAWVEPNNCTQRKSFAHFNCSCGARWTTAHGYADSKQGCKQCGDYSLPCCMWQNNNSSFHNRSDYSDEDGGPPHRKDLCERCQQGLPCTLT